MTQLKLKHAAKTVANVPCLEMRVNNGGQPAVAMY